MPARHEGMKNIPGFNRIPLLRNINAPVPIFLNILILTVFIGLIVIFV